MTDCPLVTDADADSSYVFLASAYFEHCVLTAPLLGLPGHMYQACVSHIGTLTHIH